MTKRYYYTDSLEAAWMADNFNMKFFATNGEDLEREYTADFYFLKPWRIYCLDVYYIHPDSEHILEPQVGDVVTDGVCYAEVSETGEAILHDCSTIDVREIIQRNGKAFMWPEVEDV